MIPVFLFNVPVAGVRSNGSMAGDLVSDWVHKDEQTAGCELAWTGTAAGAFSVELSFDGTNVSGTLAASDFSPALTAPAGSPGRFHFAMTNIAPYYRVKYTRTSGDGTLSGIHNEMRG